MDSQRFVSIASNGLQDKNNGYYNNFYLRPYGHTGVMPYYRTPLNNTPLSYGYPNTLPNTYYRNSEYGFFGNPAISHNHSQGLNLNLNITQNSNPYIPFYINPNSNPANGIGISNNPNAAESEIHKKPEFSYASLIAQAINDSPTNKRTLNEIYEFILEKYPYYKKHEGWQNSIRHNLSLHKGFTKVKRKESIPGKGHLWAITKGYEKFFSEGHFKSFKTKAKPIQGQENVSDLSIDSEDKKTTDESLEAIDSETVSDTSSVTTTCSTSSVTGASKGTDTSSLDIKPGSLQLKDNAENPPKKLPENANLNEPINADDIKPKIIPQDESKSSLSIPKRDSIATTKITPLPNKVPQTPKNKPESYALSDLSSKFKSNSFSRKKPIPEKRIGSGSFVAKRIDKRSFDNMNCQHPYQNFNANTSTSADYGSTYLRVLKKSCTVADSSKAGSVSCLSFSKSFDTLELSRNMIPSAPIQLNPSDPLTYNQKSLTPDPPLRSSFVATNSCPKYLSKSTTAIKPHNPPPALQLQFNNNPSNYQHYEKDDSCYLPSKFKNYSYSSYPLFSCFPPNSEFDMFNTADNNAPVSLDSNLMFLNNATSNRTAVADSLLSTNTNLGTNNLISPQADSSSPEVISNSLSLSLPPSANSNITGGHRGLPTINTKFDNSLNFDLNATLYSAQQPTTSTTTLINSADSLFELNHSAYNNSNINSSAIDNTNNSREFFSDTAISSSKNLGLGLGLDLDLDLDLGMSLDMSMNLDLNKQPNSIFDLNLNNPVENGFMIDCFLNDLNMNLNMDMNNNNVDKPNQDPFLT